MGRYGNLDISLAECSSRNEQPVRWRTCTCTRSGEHSNVVQWWYVCRRGLSLLCVRGLRCNSTGDRLIKRVRRTFRRRRGRGGGWQKREGGSTNKRSRVFVFFSCIGAFQGYTLLNILGREHLHLCSMFIATIVAGYSSKCHHTTALAGNSSRYHCYCCSRGKQ